MVMKEAYFTRNNVRQKAVEMLREVESDIRQPVFDFAPRRAALLVIDMQNFFLREQSHAFIPSAQAAIPAISSLIRAFGENGRPIIFTRHLNTSQNAGLMGKWWDDILQESDSLSEISEELDISAGLIITKSQYDGFYETSLEDILREKQISQLVICGVMTHLCCETTARSAFVRGFEVFFPVDATATDSRGHHLASLRNLGHGFAAPMLTEEIVRLLSVQQ